MLEISCRPLLVIYAIFKRTKTDTLTKSKTKTKTMAPTSTLANTQNGSGVMSQPNPARVAAINRSTTDEETSQRQGCGVDQIRPRARTQRRWLPDFRTPR